MDHPFADVAARASRIRLSPAGRSPLQFRAAALIRDGADFFNAKNTQTADATDARYVGAVWDRLASAGGGPSFMAGSTDAGVTWEPARAIYAPAVTSQTIGNRVVVLPDGTLVDFFTQIDAAGGAASAHLDVVRSIDKGVNWSAPFRVSTLQAVGARDPDTAAPMRDAAILGSIAVGPDGGLWAVWQDARFSGGHQSQSQCRGVHPDRACALRWRRGRHALRPAQQYRRTHHAARRCLAADVARRRHLDRDHGLEPFDLAGAPRVDGGRFRGDYQGQNIVRTLEQRLPGWSRRMRLDAPSP